MYPEESSGTWTPSVKTLQRISWRGAVHARRRRQRSLISTVGVFTIESCTHTGRDLPKMDCYFKGIRVALCDAESNTQQGVVHAVYCHANKRRREAEREGFMRMNGAAEQKESDSRRCSNFFAKLNP